MRRLAFIFLYVSFPFLANIFGNEVEWGMWILGVVVMLGVVIVGMLEEIIRMLTDED